MLASGESQKEVIRPDFNRLIMIDFQRAKITPDTGSLLLLDVDKRFAILGPMREGLEDLRSPQHTKSSLVHMVRQRVYQIAAGYEDCNDADFLRIDPALRLALGKDRVWESPSHAPPTGERHPGQRGWAADLGCRPAPVH